MGYASRYGGRNNQVLLDCGAPEGRERLDDEWVIRRLIGRYTGK